MPRANPEPIIMVTPASARDEVQEEFVEVSQEDFEAIFGDLSSFSSETQESIRANQTHAAFFFDKSATSIAALIGAAGGTLTLSALAVSSLALDWHKFSTVGKVELGLFALVEMSLEVFLQKLLCVR